MHSAMYMMLSVPLCSSHTIPLRMFLIQKENFIYSIFPELKLVGKIKEISIIDMSDAKKPL